MLHFPSHYPSPSPSSKSIPPRTDSLASQVLPSNGESKLLDVASETNQARMMLERDSSDPEIREVLRRMISRVEEFSSLLTAAYKTQTELETQLTLAKSNLQLALANTEMLEEALKREGGPDHGKDIGWRRWSAREGVRRSAQIQEDPVTRNSLEIRREDSGQEDLGPSLESAKPQMSPARATSQDSRFFRFRLRGSDSRINSQPEHSPLNSMAMETAQATPMHIDTRQDMSHLTSASMPSLVLSQDMSALKKEAELKALLEEEKKKCQLMTNEKTALESELESLSQALFEEANKMVATERRRLAEVDEELRVTKEEKQALKSALRLIEGENDRLRQSSKPPLLKTSSYEPPMFKSLADRFPLGTGAADIPNTDSSQSDTTATDPAIASAEAFLITRDPVESVLAYGTMPPTESGDNPGSPSSIIENPWTTSIS